MNRNQSVKMVQLYKEFSIERGMKCINCGKVRKTIYLTFKGIDKKYPNRGEQIVLVELGYTKMRFGTIIDGESVWDEKFHICL